MRTITTIDYKMTYPDVLSFAFNRNFVRFENLNSDITSIALSIQYGNETKTEIREVYNNSVIFDISRYMQMMFADVNWGAKADYSDSANETPSAKDMSVVATLNYRTTSSEIAMWQTTVLWGKIRREDTNKGMPLRRWFINYPFSVAMWEGSSQYLEVDYGNYQEYIDIWKPVALSCGRSYVEVIISQMNGIDPMTNPSSRYIKVSIADGITWGTEGAVNVGETNGYTLFADSTPYDLNKYCFLRWYDSQGRMCYYLFKRLGFVDNVNSSTFIQDRMTDGITYDIFGNVCIANDARQKLTKSRTYNIGIKSLPMNEYEYVSSLLTSPVVDVLDDFDADNFAKWHRVQITPTNTSRTIRDIQEFNISYVDQVEGGLE